MGIKVVIDQRTLRGSGQELQRVATVYSTGSEYRVYAPAKAIGDLSEWLEECLVHQSSAESPGSDVEAPIPEKVLILKAVHEELDRLQRVAIAASPTRFYHVRLQTIESPEFEVRFDLLREELEKRVIEPYENLTPPSPLMTDEEVLKTAEKDHASTVMQIRLTSNNQRFELLFALAVATVERKATREPKTNRESR